MYFLLLSHAACETWQISLFSKDLIKKTSWENSTYPQKAKSYKEIFIDVLFLPYIIYVCSFYTCDINWEHPADYM